MMHTNDNDRRHTITVERWDDGGELNGCHLVTLLEAGKPEPIDAQVCGSKDEAFDFAKEVMESYPNGLFHDQSGQA